MKLKVSVIMLVVAAVTASNLFAHCQIPCGIYGDEARFTQLKEDARTIEKSMKLIGELSASADKNYNQIVRWVNNKEEHANKIIETATHYFLAQRIKPVDANDADAVKMYQDKLLHLHHIILYSMKCKQTTDKANVEKLNSVITEFETLYFEK